MLLRARAPPPPDNSNTPLLRGGIIAALVLSSLVAFLLLIAALVYICKRGCRRCRARYQDQRRDHVNLNRFLPRISSFRGHTNVDDPQEKDQVDSAKEQPFRGVILDIGPVENNDDSLSLEGVSATGVCGGHRDSSYSGFARWKRGLSTLSGLTALGLNFGHSDEKSPVSDDGDGEGRNFGLGMRVSHSLGRFGSNKSTGNGKGKARLSGSHDQSHDAESLSGLTSLSYISNISNNGHPPSYAASVSHNSGSGSNASSQPQSAPRGIARLSLSPDTLPDHPSSQSNRLDRARISGIHILGIGGALSTIGAPISAHVALRGLSPRISRSKISGKGKCRPKDPGPERKKGEEIKKRELPQPPGDQEASGNVARCFSSPVPVATPIRALPPIPTSPTTCASQSQLPQLHPTDLSAPESFKPSTNQDPWVADTFPPSDSNNERKSKSHSPRPSLGNAAGLGFPRGVQSFAEAASLAANLTTRGILVEGRGPGLTSMGSDGEPGQATPKRLSTASRVRFEDDPTDVTSLGEARFRLSLPTGQSLPPDVASPSSAQSSSLSSDHVGTASFLDLSSQSSSPHSRQRSGASRMDFSTNVGATTDTRHELESGRIWSMHLPGRRGALKSEWSDTTHYLSESSSSNSGYGSLQAHFTPVAPASDVGTSGPPSDCHIFTVPLAIPPTSRRVIHEQPPHEPTRTSEIREIPEQMTHDQGIPDNDSQDRHGIASSQRSHTHEGVVNSPTDSFPQSISEVHFRTSVGVDSDVDLEPGRLQYARYHPVRPRPRHHHHQYQHPPLPSMPLTPQRFNPQQEPSQLQQGSGGSSIVQKLFGGGGK